MGNLHSRSEDACARGAEDLGAPDALLANHVHAGVLHDVGERALAHAVSAAAGGAGTEEDVPGMHRRCEQEAGGGLQFRR